MSEPAAAAGDGDTEPPPDATARAAAALRMVVALVDAGELEATPGQRAHLMGAVDALASQARLFEATDR